MSERTRFEKFEGRGYKVHKGGLYYGTVCRNAAGLWSFQPLRAQALGMDASSSADWATRAEAAATLIRRVNKRLQSHDIKSPKTLQEVRREYEKRLKLMWHFMIIDEVKGMTDWDAFVSITPEAAEWFDGNGNPKV